MTWDETHKVGEFNEEDGIVFIKNLRGIVSGRLGMPIQESETLKIQAGRIVELGGSETDADTVIDACGAVALPGLFDTHTHFSIGDFNPKQNTVGFIESYMHGGVEQYLFLLT